MKSPITALVLLFYKPIIIYTKKNSAFSQGVSWHNLKYCHLWNKGSKCGLMNVKTYIFVVLKSMKILGIAYYKLLVLELIFILSHLPKENAPMQHRQQLYTDHSTRYPIVWHYCQSHNSLFCFKRHELLLRVHGQYGMRSMPYTSRCDQE